ncbi:MAG: GIY-YIG nuclease family protein, partial [Candidatus Omnitrophica bacterium]|nr:GIY-YIG nuclease family protein [Candidatus Omnitrophota bacterium]
DPFARPRYYEGDKTLGLEASSGARGGYRQNRGLVAGKQEALEEMNPVRPFFFTYVLRCKKTNTFYTGAANNLEKRFEEHKKGLVFYTSLRRPVEFIYFEACLNKDDAYRRERYLKSGMGKRYLRNRLKEGLVQETTSTF